MTYKDTHQLPKLDPHTTLLITTPVLKSYLSSKYDVTSLHGLSEVMYTIYIIQYPQTAKHARTHSSQRRTFAIINETVSAHSGKPVSFSRSGHAALSSSGLQRLQVSDRKLVQHTTEMIL